MEKDKPLKESWSEIMEKSSSPDSLLDSPYRSDEDEDSGEDEMELDRLDAPVIWIRYIHGRSEETVNKLILQAFETHEVEGVEIVYTHYSNDPDRNHAYILLNSKKHSMKLLEGVIPVVLPAQGEDDEDQTLTFEEANHLEPRETQDANVLYLWNLEYKRKPKEVAEFFEELISTWSPVEGHKLQTDRFGNFNNALKIKLYCYEDTRKCIYLLNFREVEGVTIRAGFCNVDRNVVNRYRPEKVDRVKALKKNKYKKPAKALRRTPPKKKIADPHPQNKNIIKIEPGKGGWVEVPVKSKGKKGRK